MSNEKEMVVRHIKICKDDYEKIKIIAEKQCRKIMDVLAKILF